MNDPCGPMYWNGTYHMFYQYNPDASVWGNIHWGHAISSDLVHWKNLPMALAPSEPYDQAGIFTGSVTMTENGPILFYTGQKPDKTETQCIAYPEDLADPQLLKWRKDPHNPIIPSAPKLGNPKNFRDPTTAWKIGSTWYMLLGCEINGIGAALLYSSPDLKQWTYLQPLYQDSVPGNVWECPDFIQMSDTVAIFKYSKDGTQPTDFWISGSYDKKNHKFIPRESAGPRVISYGQFYASKSFFDDQTSTPRHIITGWSPEDDPKAGDRGWQGSFTLPMRVHMDNGLPVVSPIPELHSLRKEAGNYTKKLFQLEASEIIPMKSVQFEINVEFSKPPAGNMQFGIRVFANDNIFTSILYNQTGTNGSTTTGLFIDRLASGTSGGTGSLGGPITIYESDQYISLRVFVDHSIIEAFGHNGRTHVTARVYPPEGSVGISVFTTKSIFVRSITVWELTSIWNR